MKNTAGILLAGALIAGCAGTAEKVLQDFGLKDRPEGYVSGSDRVMARLNDVGKAEMNRLNLQDRHGEIRFGGEDALHGSYYKVVKVYERFYPLDANPSGRTAANREGGFVGYVEYAYQFYQGPQKKTRVEASAELADIPMGEWGRETYRYRFNSAGLWNGGKGELMR